MLFIFLYSVYWNKVYFLKSLLFLKAQTFFSKKLFVSKWSRLVIIVEDMIKKFTFDNLSDWFGKTFESHFEKKTFLPLLDPSRRAQRAGGKSALFAQNPYKTLHFQQKRRAKRAGKFLRFGHWFWSKKFFSDYLIQKVYIWCRPELIFENMEKLFGAVLITFGHFGSLGHFPDDFW